HPAEGGMGGVAGDVRGRFLLPLLLVPAAAEDPFAGGRLADGGGDLRDDVVPGLRRAQVEHALRLAEGDEVAVALDEARDGQAALQADDASVLADELADLAVGA